MNSHADILDKKRRKVEALELITSIDADSYRRELEGKDKAIRYVAWEEVDMWIDELATHAGRWSGIYAIPKAGLPLAVALCNRAKLPLLMAPEENCLVIDDVANTGLALFPYVNRYEIACMFDVNCPVPLDWCYEHIDARVIFPWS